MTKHLPTTTPRLEKRRQKTTSQGSFKSLGCAGIPCCPWKISKHTSTLVVVGYWAFNLWMAWSALDASGLMVVFTWFFFWGGEGEASFIRTSAWYVFSESDWRRSSSKPTLMRMFLLQGCACTHVSRCFCIKTFNVEDDQYLHISSCILSLYIFSCQLLA